MRVGLTGGVASGKSTVSSMLAELGAVVIDSDALAREVVLPGTPGLAAVVEAFGPEILTEDGSESRSGDAMLSPLNLAADAAALAHILLTDASPALSALFTGR